MYCEDVKAHLKAYRLSWIKAISAFGHDSLYRFYLTGNMPGRTAYVMKITFDKQRGKTKMVERRT